MLRSRTFRIVGLAVFLFFALLQHSAAQTNSTDKFICYSGSNLYQLVTQDCASKDSSYTGQWYCAKMEIYESFQSSSREPAITRGCATAAECTSSTSTIYSGTEILSNGNQPGGMRIVATCCAANSFPDDDTIAVDYSKICNSAGRSSLSFGVLLVSVVVAIFLRF